MKKPIWHSQSKGSAREEFVAFSAGRDVMPLCEADAELVPYDLWTNRAHAIGLARIGVYNSPQLKKILDALSKLEKEWRAGTWRLDAALEDVHINIEAFVSEQCGEAVGGKLHSGRSRNDQVATDMKLFARDRLLDFLDEIAGLLDALANHALQHVDAVMPGYTHHRKATIASWGHWVASYAQGALRDAGRLTDIYKRMNVCPLGAAAAYGTTWSLDRKLVADLLAFDGVQENALDAVSSRGEAEAEIVQGLAFLFKRLSGLSQDLILFSTEEFGYLKLPSDFTTGSSIMPQKRNPDFAEAIKGKTHALLGYGASLLSMNSCNLAGYNKDIQWSKYLFMDAAREAKGAAALLTNVIRGIEVRRDAMEAAACRGFLNAVDIADHLARSRELPFRTAYSVLSDAVGRCKESAFSFDELNHVLRDHDIEPLSEKEFGQMSDPQCCLKARDHIGSPNPKHVKSHLKGLNRKTDSLRRWIESERKRIGLAQKRCLQGGK